jgi:hypothetical protein
MATLPALLRPPKSERKTVGFAPTLSLSWASRFAEMASGFQPAVGTKEDSNY